VASALARAEAAGKRWNSSSAEALRAATLYRALQDAGTSDSGSPAVVVMMSAMLGGRDPGSGPGAGGGLAAINELLGRYVVEVQPPGVLRYRE
jgi:hypothetical protein